MINQRISDAEHKERVEAALLDLAKTPAEEVVLKDLIHKYHYITYKQGYEAGVRVGIKYGRDQ